ncbi:MAG: hypothetical protein IPO38_11675 [Rhodocyclaceae bacterium]|nr:hypothetical protein [Rhodocyclaceae bacterium]
MQIFPLMEDDWGKTVTPVPDAGTRLAPILSLPSYHVKVSDEHCRVKAKSRFKVEVRVKQGIRFSRDDNHQMRLHQFWNLHHLTLQNDPVF